MAYQKLTIPSCHWDQNISSVGIDPYDRKNRTLRKEFKTVPNVSLSRRSFDVSFFFTWIPVGNALDIMHNRPLTDSELSKRTTRSPQQVTRLLGLCFDCISFCMYMYLLPADPYGKFLRKLASCTAPHLLGWRAKQTHAKQKVEFVESNCQKYWSYIQWK